MTLTPGARLGTYQVVSKLGEGGMGEVYRARDARLGRDVAIKILPQAVAHDPERLARFEREARTLASLNHPNIATLHGLEQADGRHYLVMELVSGQTLAELIEHAGRQSTTDVPSSIAIARQIAEALEAAHEHGVVHRDLKPANVKMRDDGLVKVLDFGLAKASDMSSGSGDLATITSPAMTAAGIILGTAAYMAPEQARGKPVDKRADVWAFGVVLYELLTRQRLFQGETVTDVVAAVLTKPIDLASLPPETPRRVQEILARCLERDPKKRLRDIGEARIVLESPSDAASAIARDASVISATSAVTPALALAPPRTSIVPWAIAAIATAVAIALTAWILLNPRASTPAASTAGPVLLELGPPTGGRFSIGSNSGHAVISPDGSTVAYFVQASEGRSLMVRSIATGETRAIPNTNGAHYPFWSPDSKALGFFGVGKMFTVQLAGGLPEGVTDIVQGRGGTWTDKNEILFTPNGGGVIHRIPARGGNAVTVTTLDESRGENAHYWPVALPGGDRFLYFVRSTTPENNGIYLGSLDGTTKPVRLITSLSSAIFVAGTSAGTGRLLWVRDTDLLAQAFNPATGVLSGAVTTVATDVRVEDSQRLTFASASNDGTLVWASARAADFVLTWYNRDGKRMGQLPIAPGKVLQPALSPDGRKVAFTRAAGGTADIWSHDIASGNTTQVTTDPDYDEAPYWSPDSRLLVHQGRAGGKDAVIIRAIDGQTPPIAIYGATDISSGPFLPNGQAVILSMAEPGQPPIMKFVRLSNVKEAISLGEGDKFLTQPSPSPDGHWLTIPVGQIGRPDLALVRLHDDGTKVTLGQQRIPMTSGGGIEAHWSRDGKEIVYLTPDGTLMAVSVTLAAESATVGKPVPLFKIPLDSGNWTSNWATMPDHGKFIVLEAPYAADQRFRVLLNAR
jgi:serine/threonine protein kinase